MGGELSFAGEVLSYDAASGAVAVKQSIAGDGTAVNGYVRMDSGSFSFSLASQSELGLADSADVAGIAQGTGGS